MPVMAYSPLGGLGAPACRVIPFLAVLPQHMLAPQPLLHWPGPSAAVRLLQFLNLGP